MVYFSSLAGEITDETHSDAGILAVGWFFSTAGNTLIIDIICPGFAVDCLETLEEIQVENAHIFTAAGGLKLNYISALNDESGHVAALACILEAHAIKHHDWI